MRETESGSSEAATPYAYRKSILEKEKHFSLGAEALQVKEEGKHDLSVPYASINSVQLRFIRSKTRDTYQCIVDSERHGKLLIQNKHFAGFAEFEDRTDAYVPFVRALHDRLAGYPGRVRFKAGNLIGFLFTIFMIGVVVLLGLGALVVGAWYITAIMAFFVWKMVPVVPRSKPIEYKPQEIPPLLLPQDPR